MALPHREGAPNISEAAGNRQQFSPPSCCWLLCTGLRLHMNKPTKPATWEAFWGSGQDPAAQGKQTTTGYDVKQRSGRNTRSKRTGLEWGVTGRCHRELYHLILSASSCHAKNVIQQFAGVTFGTNCNGQLSVVRDSLFYSFSLPESGGFRRAPLISPAFFSIRKGILKPTKQNKRKYK